MHSTSRCAVLPPNKPVLIRVNPWFGFKKTIVIGHLDVGSLLAETFDHFTDGSRRSNY